MFIPSTYYGSKATCNRKISSLGLGEKYESVKVPYNDGWKWIIEAKEQ